MGNCLLTKLNGIASNNNILKLGEFQFITNKLNTGEAICNVENATLTCDKDFLVNEEIIRAGTLYNTGNKWAELKANDAGVYTVTIKNKYTLNGYNSFNNSKVRGYGFFSALHSVMENINGDYIPISSYNDSPDITSLELHGSITGNVADIKLRKLTSLSLYSKYLTGYIDNIVKTAQNLNKLFIEGPECEITGGLDLIGRLTNLNKLQISGSKISGSLESLAQQFVANGRTSGTVSGYLNKYCTYLNEVYDSTKKFTITFGSSYDNGYVITLA